MALGLHLVLRDPVAQVHLEDPGALELRLDQLFPPDLADLVRLVVPVDQVHLVVLADQVLPVDLAGHGRDNMTCSIDRIQTVFHTNFRDNS